MTVFVSLTEAAQAWKSLVFLVVLGKLAISKDFATSPIGCLFGYLIFIGVRPFPVVAIFNSVFLEKTPLPFMGEVDYFLT